MRIIKIEMENLNSLKGCWSIDFTNPDYETYHNLFVISGDTGSGKTTILDAITLALYGRTPRQKKVSKAENEIMTRHTGYCRAKVTYECKAGTFESEFYQQRARKSPNGSLQNPECRIKNLIDGTEDTGIAVSNLGEKTARIIQLDYDQFSRSIMLAQGQFDTFIMGNERERASILSKLNGTEKYRLIGARICEKASLFEKTLREVEIELKGISLLSEEDVAALEQTCTEKTAQNEKLKKALDDVAKKITWLDELKSCEDVLAEAQCRRSSYEKELLSFADERQKLEKAEHASKCNAGYAALIQVESNIRKKHKDVEKLHASLAASDASFAAAEEAYETAGKKAADAEKRLAGEESVWKEVRDYDSRLKPMLERLNTDGVKKNEAARKLAREQENLASYVKQIDALEKERTGIDDYLKNHAADEKLEQVTIVLSQKEPLIKKTARDICTKHDDIMRNQKIIEDKTHDCESAQEKLASLHAQLQNLVSTEFLSISLLLRRQLEKGKACPVCGSQEHPCCDEPEGPPPLTAGAQKVAVDVSGLNERIEDMDKKIRTLTAETASLTEKNLQLEKESEELSSSLQEAAGEVNTLIAPWSLTFVMEQNGSGNLPEIIASLQERGKTFHTKSSLMSEKEKEKEILAAKKNGVNIEELTAELAKAEEVFSLSQRSYNELSAKRKSLFADKNPDAEEQRAKRELEALKKDAAANEQKKNAAALERANIRTSIANSSDDLKDLERQHEESLSRFTDALSVNGFQSKEEYLMYRMDDASIEQLRAAEQELIRRDGETQNALQTAAARLERKQQEKNTDKTRETLTAEKASLQRQQEENAQAIGGISTQLMENESRKSKSLEINRRYEEAKEKSLRWQEMKRFIGKSGGEDFEVFVESLAFRQLLIIANRYVEAITGKYTLVQVENSVDFLVHDTHYPDNKDDRPVDNMSGGEKFIISLSLALGIAELASRNVRVDSLFLDEGFGTLSGAPLTEAIIALKSLQASGKMLGIITHIDAVIKEFDLRIEAEKTLGGTSVLKGSGVSCAAS